MFVEDISSWQCLDFGSKIRPKNCVQTIDVGWVGDGAKADGTTMGWKLLQSEWWCCSTKKFLIFWSGSCSDSFFPEKWVIYCFSMWDLGPSICFLLLLLHFLMQNTSTSPPKTPREDGSVPVTNWSYVPYEWSYKWVPGVRTRVSLSGILTLTVRTPLCGSWRAHVWKPRACSKKLQLPGTKNHRDFFGGRTSCPTTCGHLVFS